MKLDLRFAPALVALTLVACGGSSSPAQPTDAGADTSKAGDSGKADGTAPNGDSGMGGDTGGGDGAVPVPVGTALVPGDTASLVGVTSDDYVIYGNFPMTGSGTLNAIPLAGGTPKVITTFDSTSGFTYIIQGAVVLVWPGVSTKGVGAMSVWTSAGGAKVLSMQAYDGVAGISDDNKYVIYTTNVASTGATGDIYVAGVDGSNPTPLLTGLDLQGSCAPTAAFSGDYVITSYCPDQQVTDAGAPEAGGGGDGGAAEVATVSNFGGATWTRTDMFTTLPITAKACATGSGGTTGCGLFGADKAGKFAVVTDATGNLQALPIPSGAPIMVDNVGATGLGTMLSDGTAVVYTTPAKALKRSALPAVAPTTLVGTGAGTISRVSTDNKSLMYFSMQNTSMGTIDLYLASAVTPGMPTTLDSMVTGTVVTLAFTTDSSHGIYYTGVAALPPPMGGATSPGTVGTLFTIPVTGGTPNMVAPSVWNSLPGKGTKLLYQVNYQTTSAGAANGQGIADLWSVDSAGTGPGTLIVQAADTDQTFGPVFDSTQTKIIYNFSVSANTGDSGSGPDTNGIYVVAAP